MSSNKKTNLTILALYPTAYGVGYALFYTPKTLVDFGLGHIRPVNSKKSLERIQKYLSYYEPDIVLLRGFEKREEKLYKRTQKLIQAISGESENLGLKVHHYTRSEIKEVFAQFGRNSKYQIAQKIIEWYPKTKQYEFPKRKRWMAENHFAGVFDAISLGVVHYYLTQ